MMSLESPDDFPSRFHCALHFALRIHGGQPRKGTAIPYIAHPMSVAGLVLEHGGTDQEAIAAMLHDTAEDGEGIKTLREIRDQFGPSVAKIVRGCSDTLARTKPPSESKWKQRKQKHLKKLEKASASVLLVTACDKLHNARCILSDYRSDGKLLWKRFKGRRRGTLWYYNRVAQILRGRTHKRLTDELDRVVAEINELAKYRPPATSSIQANPALSSTPADR